MQVNNSGMHLCSYLVLADTVYNRGDRYDACVPA